MDKKHRLVLSTPFVNRSIISYGLIVYSSDTRKFVIIQRKHSVEFLLYMKGLYRLTHLPFLLSSITSDEAQLISLSLDPDSFHHIYFDLLDLDESSYFYAITRMTESRDYIKTLLSSLDLSQNRLAWTWPKGRISFTGSEREPPFSCAKREFEEEVEISLPPPLILSKTYIIETIQTLTGRSIESRYFFYVIPFEIPLSSPDSHPEVSDRKWVSFDECLSTLSNGPFFESKLRDLVSLVPPPFH